MSLRRRVLRYVALVTAVAMALGAFAGSASAKKLSKSQKASISKQLRKQIKKNPRAIRSKSFLRKAALVNFKLPVTIRIRGDCPAGSGGAASCPAGKVNTGLNERSQYTADVDLGPSLGQRKVSIAGSLAAEVQFRDSYDGGALGNVAIEMLPSTTKTIQTSSVPLLWNPDVDSLSSRADANFARAAIRAGAGEAGALTANGWDNKRQGCTDFKNESAPSSRTFALTGSFAGGTPGDGSYSALWYGSGLTGPNGGLPGFPVIDPAFSTTAAAYYLPVYPGIESLDQLVYGVTFNTPVADPDEYLGPQANPFPYPAIDPDPTAGDPTIAGNARDTVLRTSALDLAIAAGRPAGRPGHRYADRTEHPAHGPGLAERHHRQVRWRGEPVRQHPGQGLWHRRDCLPGHEDQLDLPRPGSGHVRLPAVAGSRYPAGVFNCREVWSGVVQNYIPGIRLTGDLRISPAITKDGKLRIAKATVNTSSRPCRAVRVHHALRPIRSETGSRFPDDRRAQAARARRRRFRRSRRQPQARRR